MLLTLSTKHFVMVYEQLPRGASQAFPLYLAMNNLQFSSSGEPKAQALLVPWPRGPGVFDLGSKSQQESKFAGIQLW